MASSSTRSSNFEASLSVASASASAAAAASVEEYDDDDFDDYSESFESDNDVAEHDEASFAVTSRSTERHLLSVKTRVQVFWGEENAWFDGAIQLVEEGNEPRYFVHYDDGGQQWEDPANIRPLPASITSAAQYDQMQLLLLNARTAREVVGRSVLVYWPDEAEWYSGSVSAATASPVALKIEYDDGDNRWEQENTFNCILLLRSTLKEARIVSPEVVQPQAPQSPQGRVLYARPYRQVIDDHFRPVRIARPYRCAVQKHSESVIIPRLPYSERRYLHVVHEALDCSQHSTTIGKVDSIAQTELPSCLTES